MFVRLLVLAGVVCVCTGLPSRVKRDSTPDFYELPANATSILATPLQTGFVCDQKVYGYYADVDNGCQVFHICHPYVDSDLIVKLRMFSFLCGPGLVFDQEKLVCNYPENSVPCQSAANYYGVNNYFGRLDLSFRDGETPPQIPESSDFKLQTFAELRESLQ
ncbi:hypothetical protein Pcinc_031628 [Petrolisthes cinctipes]|uniref:Chitin-binding type-2 domain-containing protein n=1 Tax=Petrolisthes cinctipes TaxID=88211 RepID=A0AAE1EWL6_PETCI|nr:hypothetical protein Pcinc_031628 [Petrolisthes cinctipes]